LSSDIVFSSVFRANRPGWIDEVQEGDIIVGRRDFGTGSSRPQGPQLLQGISAAEGMIARLEQQRYIG
jgi:3-isopropylmalate dehydratase small subunit